MSASSIGKTKRWLTTSEAVARGCSYCLDCEKTHLTREEYGQLYRRGTRPPRWLCPFESCPYHELDGAESYEERCKEAERDGWLVFVRHMLEEARAQ